MVRVRDAFAKLRRAQLDAKASDEQVANLRKRLNEVYDGFARKHGPINLDANRRLFRDDPTWPQISALENDFDRGVSATVAKSTGETARAPSAKKAAIFTRRTQQPYARPTSASSAKDALAIVLSDRGRVDLADMARLYGRPESVIVDELGPLLYRTPSGAYETSDQYLAGNVKAKLAEAERAAVKAHRDYRAAKAGDGDAAIRLVGDIAMPLLADARQFGEDVIFVAPHAEEASGRNAIPQTLARFLGEGTGAHVDRYIVQSSRAYHTGARPLDRLLGRPMFDGPVRRGGQYVLVDDATVMGGTLAELANHIQANGGEVVGVVTLVNASRSGIRPAAKQHVRTMEDRYGDLIREKFGIEPAALTGDESLVVLGFRDADALRAGIAKAEQERFGRLGAKGLQPSAAEEGVTAPADRERIHDIIRQVAGLSEVEWQQRIELPRGAAGWGTDAPTTAAGVYDPVADTITISLADGTERTAYHEAFHRLQRLFLTDADRAVLAAETGRLRRMVAATPARRDQARSMSGKELEAEAFAAWAASRLIEPHRAVRAVWEKIAETVRRVRNLLAGRGFTTSEDIFVAAVTGEARQRAPKPTGGSGKAYSLTENRVIEEVRGKLTDIQPALLKAIPLNYFTELARPGMTAVAEYLRVKRLLDSYRGKKHAAADEIAQSWLKYSRLGKAKTEALASLMHDATLAGVDPSKTDEETREQPAYPDLRRRLMALPIAGRKLFEDVRDAYKRQADELDKILLDNVRKAQEVAQRRAEDDYKEELARIASAGMSKSDRRQAEEEAEKRFTEQRTRAIYTMKARLTRLRIAFESSRVQEPYFPLARFGRYFVVARDVDGTVLSFSRRERAAEASATSPDATMIQVFLHRIFADDPRIAPPEPGSARFGSKGLRVGGKVFAMEWQGALAVKLSSDRVLTLAATGAGAPLLMGNRTMKEWLVADAPSTWPSLAEEARDFAAK